MHFIVHSHQSKFRCGSLRKFFSWTLSFKFIEIKGLTRKNGSLVVVEIMSSFKGNTKKKKRTLLECTLRYFMFLAVRNRIFFPSWNFGMGKPMQWFKNMKNLGMKTTKKKEKKKEKLYWLEILTSQPSILEILGMCMSTHPQRPQRREWGLTKMTSFSFLFNFII